MSSTSNSQDVNHRETDARWYPRSDESRAVTDLNRAMNEQKIDLENKLLTARNEIIVLRHEILSLKGKFLQLNEEFLKCKSVTGAIDVRKRNRLLREKIPFAFMPEEHKNTDI